MSELVIQRGVPKSGAELMAEDQELLSRAERGEIGPVLRFYTWKEPTVSLGYHQNSGVLDHRRLADASVPWVRRPTGGAAVLHSDELTYAVVLPWGAHPGTPARVQEHVSLSLARGLRSLGLAAEVDERGEPLASLPNRVSCFVRTSRWEVTVRGRKIVGSAQRKLSHALLQHGSILMGDDHLRITQFLKIRDESSRSRLLERLRERATSIHQELGRDLPVNEVEEAILDGFEHVFGEFVERFDRRREVLA